MLSKNQRFGFVLASLLCLLTWAALATGCGDSSDGSGSSGASAAAEDGAAAGEAPAGEEDAPQDGASGEDGEGGATDAKDKFLEEANDICAERLTAMLSTADLYVKGRSGKGKSEAVLQAETVDSIMVPSMERQVEEIRELKPPPGDEGRVEAFLSAREEGIAASKRKRYTAANIESFGSEYSRSSKLAQQYGLTSCSLGY